MYGPNFSIAYFTFWFVISIYDTNGIVSPVPGEFSPLTYLFIGVGRVDEDTVVVVIS